MEVPACVQVPKFAYRYWPRGEEAVQAPGKFGRRLIFGRQEFSDSEEELVQEMEQALDGCEGMLESLQRQELLRFGYAGKWEVQEATQLLLQHMEWVMNEFPAFYPGAPPLDLLVTSKQTSGGLYLHGRDLKYRPVLVAVPSRLHKFPIQRITQAGAYLLEYVIGNMLLPGQIENFGLILDFADCDNVACSIEVDIRQDLKQISGFFMRHYPCRLAWGCALNGKYSFWSRATAVLDPDTSEKFQYSPSPAKLFSLCHPTQLESKYQGLAPDLNTYWPPNFPKLPRSLLLETDCTNSADYSSYQEYHPERSMTDTSGFGTERDTSYRDAVEAAPGDQTNLSMDSDDLPEVKKAEDQELSEAMETLRGKVRLTKVRNRNRERKPMTHVEKTAVRQRGWCSCMVENGEPGVTCCLS